MQPANQENTTYMTEKLSDNLSVSSPSKKISEKYVNAPNQKIGNRHRQLVCLRRSTFWDHLGIDRVGGNKHTHVQLLGV